MRRIINSDIKFPLANVKGLTENFTIRFYTTNEEFCLEYDQDNVYFEGVVPYLKLSWNDLKTIGEGVLNYILFTYKDDDDFDDNVYDQSYSRTTQYYIDSNLKIDDGDDAKTIMDMLDELNDKIDNEITRSTNVDDRQTGEISDLQDLTNELDERIGDLADELDERMGDMSDEIALVDNRVDDVQSDMDTMERVIAEALNDLNSRLLNLEQ